jgi:hypothetical protein
MQHHMTIIFHPRLHFPLDTVNAVTQSLLPDSHRLKHLLTPHFRYTLGLHKAVVHHQRSTVYNSQREVHAANTFVTEDVIRGVALGMQGRGNAAYPPYNFFNVHIGTHTTYGRYRQAWYHHTLEFTRKMVATFEPGDPDISRWADAISPLIAGFPDGTAIWGEDILAKTLATIIATTSVFHSGDHHSYARIPVEKLPKRLRRKPPDESEPKTLELKNLTLPEDHFRNIMTTELFIRPAVRSKLSSVQYEFRSPAARDASAEFVEGMSVLDHKWGPNGFATSDEIAASIQY